MQPNEPLPVLPGGEATVSGSESQLFPRPVSPAMRALERVIADIAPTSVPILLVGERGTGKEKVALEIHRLSRQQTQPFKKISCTALSPSSLAEWLDGSPNGDGVAEPAALGTVFLDEVSELNPACQSELLRGGPNGDAFSSTHVPGLRWISASSRNLEEEMRARRLSEELYYRMSGVCLRLPPLRQRREDVPGLVDCFLAKYGAVYGRPQPTLSSETLQALLDHSWPGNIRELENIVEKIVALGDERIAVAELVPHNAELRSANGAAEVISLKETARRASRKAERQLILKVLTRTRWNRKRAAQELQISYKALLYKLKQIGFEDSGAA
jgi:two-component system, NtrC family, response regulator AtoC